MPKKIRIVSDLHIGHRASYLTSPAALRPLAEGVDMLVFNGDTLELKYARTIEDRLRADDLLRRFNEEVASWGIETVVITGNHDPAISDIHELELLGGEVYLTHGDALFKDVAPWSSNARNLRSCIERLHKNAPSGDLAISNRYIKLSKSASIEAHQLDSDHNPTLWGKLKIFLHQAWPPTRPLKILQCWSQVPDKAVAFTRRFGKTPRFIILGHTHNPRIWRRSNQVIVNLGSFFPWPGARCVDIADGSLTVRRLRKAHDRIEIGSILASFALGTATQSSRAAEPHSLQYGES